jgi:hypothetical protein
MWICAVAGVMLFRSTTLSSVMLAVSVSLIVAASAWFQAPALLVLLHVQTSMLLVALAHLQWPQKRRVRTPEPRSDELRSFGVKRSAHVLPEPGGEAIVGDLPSQHLAGPRTDI